jgi:hypothetical protein
MMEAYRPSHCCLELLVEMQTQNTELLHLL